MNEMIDCLFIGGPCHRHVHHVPNLPVIEIEDGQYHRHFLGVEGSEFEQVFIWSELGADEAVDLVIASVGSRSCTEPIEPSVGVQIKDGSCWLRIAIDSVEIHSRLSKRDIGKLIDSLTQAFNTVDED